MSDLLARPEALPLVIGSLGEVTARTLGRALGALGTLWP